MKKRLLALFTSLLMVVSLLSACNSTPAPAAGTADPGKPAQNTPAPGDAAKTTPTYTWSIGMNSVEGDIPYYMAEKFKELVEEKSAGDIQVNLYPGGQMGGDAELTENVIAGTLDFYCGNTSNTVPYVTAASVLDGHWEFDSMDHFRRMMDGDFFGILNAEYEKAGMRMISFAEVGERQLMSNRPINVLSDLNGLKVRVMQNKYHIAAWQALGASPTPMDWGEVYVGLQQKMIDAVEQPYFFICSNKLYEVQSYMLKTHHMVQPAVLFMSQNVYSALPDDIKALVDECGQEAKEYTRGVCDDLTSQRYQEILDKKVTVSEVTPELLAQMRELVAPATGLIRQDVGDAFFDQYAACRDAAR